jgi:transposase
MYYHTMATIVYKRKKGNEYAYWVRSARVDGKPRIVEQVYLGPKDRFLEEVKAAYTRDRSPGPTPLERVGSKEFGATAWLWQWAEELGLREIVDRHVPAPPGRRSTQLSVGQYLVIAALNRAVDPKSKRSLYEDWYKDSVLSRLWKAKAQELSSQRFWDHMDQVEAEHIEEIQRDVMMVLAERFGVGGETILYDSTNFFTFLDTFNERGELAQRGNNKQKRMDLRQLSLALFEDRETLLPLYHRCYAGNEPDARAFPLAWEAFLRQWPGETDRRAEQLTLVFDGGNTSKANLRHLDEHAVHYVGGVPVSWQPDLLEVELSEYGKLELGGTKHVKAYRTKRELWGKERTVVVVFSPTLYRAQRKSMNREEAKAKERLRELAAQIDAWRESRRGKGHSEKSVRRKVRQWTSREHLRDYLDVQVEAEGDRVVRLAWTWDGERKRSVQRRYLGKKMIVTDHHDWDDASIVLTYRRLTRTESLFKMSKSDPGLWWPMFHWTDSKIRVHALYCFFALLLVAILRQKLREAGVVMGVGRAVERLAKVRESVVVYTNGATDRVLMELDDTQQELAQALNLTELAEQLGTTVLEPR